MIDASIIITSYNYERFLRHTIDSALNQSHPNTEVIVVDDGSTDNSRGVIASYGGRIVPILKANGGIGSAYNAAYAVSHGRVVFLLDSDDMLLPKAVENALPLFDDANVVKVHWPLWEIDENGQRTGRLKPSHDLAEGDLREQVIREGPYGYTTPPTSGNAYARNFLRQVSPVFETTEFWIDAYLSGLAPFFGLIRRITEPQGCYRVHDQNLSGMPFVEHLRRELWGYEHRCHVLSRLCQDRGINVDGDIWKESSWIHRLSRTTEEIKHVIPEGETFILVDEDKWAMDPSIGRQPIPFLERHGEYWGRPGDDITGIAELERLRQVGASFIVFGWPAFWWLDHYPGLDSHLRAGFRLVLENDRLLIFDLRPSPVSALNEPDAEGITRQRGRRQ